jgi:hypothetical protein
MSDIFDHLNDAFDSLDYMDEFPVIRSVICKHCGTRDLHWLETDLGWRLYDDNNKMHACRSSKSLNPAYPKQIAKRLMGNKQCK